MKVLVTHDKRGTITSIGMPGAQFADGIGVYATNLGEKVAVLDVADIQHIGDLQLEEILRDYVVHVKAATPKLVKKSKRG